jgi:hypothetical protein
MQPPCVNNLPPPDLKVSRPPGFSEEEAWARARQLLTDVAPAAKPAVLRATQQPTGELQVGGAGVFVESFADLGYDGSGFWGLVQLLAPLGPLGPHTPGPQQQKSLYIPAS